MKTAENRYVKFNQEFMHYQIEKFNGTHGNALITTDNVGVLIDGMYVFKEVNGVIPQIFHCLLIRHRSACKPSKGPLVSFFDSNIDKAHDEDEAGLIERFELRLLKAKTMVDVHVAKLYFAAGQVNRLSIKQSLKAISV